MHSVRVSNFSALLIIKLIVSNKMKTPIHRE